MNIRQGRDPRLERLFIPDPDTRDFVYPGGTLNVDGVPHRVYIQGLSSASVTWVSFTQVRYPRHDIHARITSVSHNLILSICLTCSQWARPPTWMQITDLLVRDTLLMLRDQKRLTFIVQVWATWASTWRQMCGRRWTRVRRSTFLM